MIEINLLPGSGKKSRGRSGAAGGAAIGAAFSGAAARIKDPYLIGAVAGTLVAVLALGGLHLTQQARASTLTAREQRAVQDSTRYAAVLAEKLKAEAQRDSVLRQLNIIKAIDNNRFVWAHVLDEVSRTLPPYTWLTSLQQTSAPPAASDAATPAGAKGAAAKADSVATQPAMTFRMVGSTVDIQALTRFMKELEASPFVQNVSLFKTVIVLQEAREVTEFTLDAEYQIPDPSAIRTVPVSLSVR